MLSLTPQEVIKVLLVEDEPLWQQGIRILLDMQPLIQLTAIVDNADAAEKAFAETQPDVLLIDWKIKGSRDGLQLAEALCDSVLPGSIILVTGSPAEQIPRNPYGYVPKSRVASDLVPAIMAAMDR